MSISYKLNYKEAVLSSKDPGGKPGLLGHKKISYHNEILHYFDLIDISLKNMQTNFKTFSIMYVCVFVRMLM